MIMKINRMFIYAAALMVAACGKEVAPEGVTPDETVTPEYAVSFTAHTESDPASKATIGLNGENKPQTFWENGDIISVYSSGQTASNKIGFKFSTVLSSNSTSATFGYTGEDFVTGSYMAIYPHMEAARAANFTAQEDANGNYEGEAYRMAAVDVPQTQTLVAGGFDRKAMVMTAYTDNLPELKFKNAVALIKFKVSDTDIVSGKIVAEGAVISGCFRADIKTDTHEPMLIKYNQPTYNSIEFALENSAALAADTEYYVAVRPTTLTDGFAIYLNDKLVKTYSDLTEFKRNGIYNLGTLAIPEGAVEVVSKSLTFDFTDAVAMSGWPAATKYSETASDQAVCPYVIDGVTYNFISAQPYDVTTLTWPYFKEEEGNNRIIIPTQRYLGLPAIQDHMLTRVVFTVVSGNSANYIISSDIAIGTNTPTIVSGGEQQTGAKKTYVFELSDTETGAQYWLKTWVKAVAISSMTLTYTQVTTQE
jgi:hypothetical protein